MASDQTPYGAQWPDVAIALIDFVREEPSKFAIVFILVSVAVWVLLPRFTHILSRNYQAELLKQQKENQESDSSPSKDDTDV